MQLLFTAMMLLTTVMQLLITVTHLLNCIGSTGMQLLNYAAI